MLERLPVAGWALEAEPVLRGGHRRHQGPRARRGRPAVVRTAAHIPALVAEARLPDRVQRRALGAVFAALAEAEGRLHRRPPETRCTSTRSAARRHRRRRRHLRRARGARRRRGRLARPVAVGLGMVRAAHGMLPNPAPAVVELLAGAPTYGVDLAVELTTPTGAALLAADWPSSWGPMPAMTSSASGLRRRHRRARRPAQPHAGGARRRRPTPPAGGRPAGGAARGQRRRRHRRGAGPHGRRRCSTPAPTTPGSPRSS